jgi:hypothetical protein
MAPLLQLRLKQRERAKRDITRTPPECTYKSAIQREQITALHLTPLESISLNRNEKEQSRRAYCACTRVA